MSATLQPDWLKSVDTESYHPEWTNGICSIPEQNRVGGPWEITKSCTAESIDEKKVNEFAKRILEIHNGSVAGKYGRITLVVCNTVERAFSTYNELKKQGRKVGIELVHSRFRPAEREEWRDRFLSRESCKPEVDRIIVATQVVEAGVDISATCLITELAPWPSLVQRFGRCARYDGVGQVIVIDRGHDEKTSLPYAQEEMENAWNCVQSLSDVGIRSIEAYEQSLTPESRANLYQYSPAHLLLRNEFDELFDTTPDLTGADLDISRFIRSGDERDLQIFWRPLSKDASTTEKTQPHRRELCSVPFLKARDWLCGPETKSNRKPKLLGRMRAWIWDWIDGEWIEPRRENLLPGRIVCVDAACGGYEIDSGFAPESKATVPIVILNDNSKSDLSLQADNQEDGEDLSISAWKTIACHSQEVVDEATSIASKIGLSSDLAAVIELAARWHDIGKSHPAFQGSIRHDDRPMREDLAKGPDEAWLKPRGSYRYSDDSEDRPGFRHELASALAMFTLLETYQPNHPALLGNWAEVFEAMGRETYTSTSNQTHTGPIPSVVQSVLDCTEETFDLLVYLIASHHGKVRAALHASPKDQQYRDRDNRGLPIRGIREGDCLPSLQLDDSQEPIPELRLTLEPATLGLSMRTGASWRERCLALQDRHSPTTLAYLESLLRAADIRASRLKTGDPMIANSATVETMAAI